MLSDAKQMPDEILAPKKSKKRDLKVKILSHEETRELQEAMRVKYKKAFDLLKDK